MAHQHHPPTNISPSSNQPLINDNVIDLLRNIYHFDGFDPRQHIANFIQQPGSQHNIESSTNLATSSSPSPNSGRANEINLTVSKGKSTCTTVNSITSNANIVNGMANISPSQLLTNSIAFPSNSQQLQIQTSQHSPQTLQNNSSSPLIQQLNRPRVKSRSSNNNNNNHSLNGISNIPAQQIFGTSVAFPGNLQSINQGQNQSFQQSRQNQMQQQSQQVLTLPSLDVSSLNTSQSRNLATNSPTITSNNAAAVAAAVAVAHPQYTQYITSWPCPACKIGFRSANELQTHLSAHFVPSQKQTTQQNSVVNTNFNNSNATFNNNNNNTKKDQSVHLKKDKSVPCNECGKLFASAERVRVHVRVAHGEKTCSCEICGCGFSYRCKLLNHMRTHTGDKPFTCEVCGRSFSQKNHLKRHHMIHTGERPFPCEICGRSFYRKDKLTRHHRIHTNPNPVRGARNAKNTAIPVNPNAVKMPVTQSFANLPGSAIQLIPVSMATQIRGATSLGGQSWVQVQQNNRSNSSNMNNQLNKSNNGQQHNQRNQQSTNQVVVSLPVSISSEVEPEKTSSLMHVVQREKLKQENA